MNLSDQIRNNSPSRQDRLAAFLRERRIRNRDLARALDVVESTVSDIKVGRRATQKHIEALVALGIPRDLLPEVQPPRKPGRKSNAERAALQGDAA